MKVIRPTAKVPFSALDYRYTSAACGGDSATLSLVSELTRRTISVSFFRKMPEESQSNELLLLRSEVARYKSLYEQEREQFLEFQRCSKELETELDMELAAYKKKISELEANHRRMANELENVKSRYEKERPELLATENQLRTKLHASDENNKELKQKLRRVEQVNDDLERRERIQAQEIHDWANRYEKCLERCAYLEAGIFNGELQEEGESNVNGSNGSILSSSNDVLSDRTNLNQLHQSILNSSPLHSPTTNNHKSTDVEMLPADSNNHTPETTTPRNGFYSFGSSLKKNFLAFSTPLHKERPSSAIVNSLFRKIEEVEKQVDPKKYVIHRTPNRK